MTGDREANLSSAGLGALPRPVAVAVGGGGVLGAAHVGVGHALEQRGFVPDLVVGTSVGALNGAIAAGHPGEAAQWLDNVWARLRRREVFPLGYLSSRASIFTDHGLRRLIARAGLPARIEQLAIPFTAVAVDLGTGAEVLLDHGDLESALLASAAIPGVLPPVDRDGRTLVDGGVVAHVPRLRCPLLLITLGGFHNGANDITHAEHLYQLTSAGDRIERVGTWLFPQRWRLMRRSGWNQARRAGKVTTQWLDPATHVGPLSYISPTAELPDGRSHLDRTADTVIALIRTHRGVITATDDTVP